MINKKYIPLFRIRRHTRSRREVWGHVPIDDRIHTARAQCGTSRDTDLLRGGDIACHKNQNMFPAIKRENTAEQHRIY